MDNNEKLYWPEATEQAIELLMSRIVKAWLVNAHIVYPNGAAAPDPKGMATVAAKAAFAFFIEIIEESKKEVLGEGTPQ